MRSRGEYERLTITLGKDTAEKLRVLSDETRTPISTMIETAVKEKYLIPNKEQ